MTAATIKSYVRGRPRLKRLVLLWMRLFAPFVQSNVAAIPRYIQFVHDWQEYKRRSQPAVYPRISDWYPCLWDKTINHSIDAHYFYQDIWAFKKVLETKTTLHIDVGSRDIFVGMLSAITNVVFVDIRPLVVHLGKLHSVRGSILRLPFRDNCIQSISCLNVAEHIGLGRYGDPIDPSGTLRACDELKRVLAPHGHFYFSLPIGRPRVCFNAHRIHTVDQILAYLSGLALVEFSGVDDKGKFVANLPLKSLDSAEFSCGLFMFRKIL